MPVDVTNEKVKENLSKLIKDGKFHMGELIVPQTFEKTIMKNGKIQKEIVEIKGRKIPLKDIRSDMIKQHERYMRNRTDEDFVKLNRNQIIQNLKNINELPSLDLPTPDLLTILKKYERTRNLMFWHDGSSLSNHGHILIMAATIYDPAMFLTDEEYHAKYFFKCNVQAAVESPFLYIVARCPSNEQQLLYSDERIKDIMKLTDPILTRAGIPIHDVTRIFKGDDPAAQLEAGQQKGGNYYCWVCPVEASRANDIAHVMNKDYYSMQDRINKIKLSVSSKDKLKSGTTKLYSNLDKIDIADELHQRKIKFRITQPVKELKEKLLEEMHGIQRLPALMFYHPFHSLSDLNIDRYEVLKSEPLHDITNHIKNLYSELPFHFNINQRKEFINFIEASYNGKEAKNGSDHRESLLLVCIWLQQHHPTHYVTKILQNLSEIQEILYSPDNIRTTTSVFRFNNITFEHANLLNNHFKQPKSPKLTSRKLFGTYYHSLTKHASEQYRLFSGRCFNTEKEEATFNKLKISTNLTSNHHPDNVITNAIIRLQANYQLKNTYDNITSSCKRFSNYSLIKCYFKNTQFTFDYIMQNYREYQCLLERIADYLLEEGVWWIETHFGVEFLDLKKPSMSAKSLHHFRSYLISEELAMVSECWQQCIKNKNNLIPAWKIKVEDKNGENIKILKLSTLKYFNKLETEVQDQTPTTVNKFESLTNEFNDLQEIRAPITTYTLETLNEITVQELSDDYHNSKNKENINGSSFSKNKSQNSSLTEVNANAIDFQNCTPIPSTPTSDIKNCSHDSLTNTSSATFKSTPPLSPLFNRTNKSKSNSCEIAPLTSTPFNPTKNQSNPCEILTLKPKKELSKSALILKKFFG